MKNDKDRVIIDTNLWISFLLTKNYASLDTIISNSKITLVFSQELIDEIIEVTQRRKFKKYFDIFELEILLLEIRKRALFVKVSSIVGDCRDEKDNFLLALAKDANASHLITGDKDLLVLEKFQQTKILTMSEYLKQM
ncbi:MAG: putative toxin-antitoxin system toxin component, PIN family [Bacteroidetes bacterium]|nr:putative toxin-antitoxin system toxin component, PIN family [Bacteroidota bacterium]